MQEIIWKHRVVVLITALAGMFTSSDLPDNFATLGIIGCGVFVGMLETIRERFYPTMNEQSGCGIMFLLIVSSIIIGVVFI